MELFIGGVLFGAALVSGWAQRREWMVLKEEREWKERYMRDLAKSLNAQIAARQKPEDGSPK